jgi:hypothetical protein
MGLKNSLCLFQLQYQNYFLVIIILLQDSQIDGYDSIDQTISQCGQALSFPHHFFNRLRDPKQLK